MADATPDYILVSDMMGEKRFRLGAAKLELASEMADKFLPLAAANEFIRRAGNEGVSHMKLQKLVYMAHEAWLRDHAEPFLSDNPQVWQYGPVFGHLYHDLKYHKAEPIREPQKLFDIAPRIDNDDVLKTIDSVWQKYRNVSATTLSDITHRSGSPWQIIAKTHNFKVPLGTEIPADLIAEYARNKP